MKKKKVILFVCTGNSCRSVIAEELFKKMLAGALQRYPEKNALLSAIEVLSAGVAPLPGMNPPHGTLEVMQEEGIDVSGYRAVSLSDDLIKASSLIVVMERRHKEEMLDLAPKSGYKIVLLKKFAGKDSGVDSDIHDPIGNSIDVYKKCAGEIKESLCGLLGDIINGKIAI